MEDELQKLTRSERLKSARKATSSTVEEVAAVLGISRAWLYKIEDGELPNRKVAEAISDLYGIPVEQIGYADVQRIVLQPTQPTELPGSAVVEIVTTPNP